MYASHAGTVGKGWENVSHDAKSLVRRMLEFSPTKRISAEAALRDRWIASLGKKTATEPMQIKQTLSNLQSFKVG